MAVTSASQNSETPGKNVLVTIAATRTKEPSISAGKDRKIIVNTLLQRPVGMIAVFSLISDGLICLNTGLLDFLRLRFEYSTRMSLVGPARRLCSRGISAFAGLGDCVFGRSSWVGGGSVTNGAATGSYVRQVLQNGRTTLQGCFFVRLNGVSPSRPELCKAPRGAAVNAGRRPPPKAARSGVEGREHGAIVELAGPLMPLVSASVSCARANDPC